MSQVFSKFDMSCVGSRSPPKELDNLRMKGMLLYLDITLYLARNCCNDSSSATMYVLEEHTCVRPHALWFVDLESNS